MFRAYEKSIFFNALCSFTKEYCWHYCKANKTIVLNRSYCTSRICFHELGILSRHLFFTISQPWCAHIIQIYNGKFFSFNTGTVNAPTAKLSPDIEKYNLTTNTRESRIIFASVQVDCIEYFWSVKRPVHQRHSAKERVNHRSVGILEVSVLSVVRNVFAKALINRLWSPARLKQ